MHRIYICTRFTCFTYTAKMVLFTWLEHSANTNTLAIAPGRIKGVGFKLLANFRTQESFEKIYYKYIPLYRFDCFESSFKAIESFIPVILPCGTLFCHIFVNIGITLPEKTNSWSQPAKWEKWCHSPEEHFGRKLQDRLDIEHFQKASVTMFWYLEHGSTLYLK